MTSTTPLRFVTAASLFDGHDAAINIMRRVLQAEGAEVVHLGHDRSAHDIVTAAIDEDADAIAVSSYQGGHNEFFAYMVELLGQAGRGDIAVFGGGGGTITDKEITALHAAGVRRIYSVEDGRRLGLQGMIRDMMESVQRPPTPPPPAFDAALSGDRSALGRVLTALEHAHADGDASALAALRAGYEDAAAVAPVLGITGTGGAGKSSLTDELARRFVHAYPDARLAVLSIDPTRRRSGGALLGDRIRMNTASHGRVYMRSMATRQANASVSPAALDAVAVLRRAGFDLVIVETAGVGQSGAEVVELSDVSLYVMTPEFGAPSQLEKIEMLDAAHLVAVNKCDKRGGEDALRLVAKQMQRNRGAFTAPLADMPVFGCVASRFGDPGVDALFAACMARVVDAAPAPSPRLARATVAAEPTAAASAAPARVGGTRAGASLDAIVASVRGYRARGEAACGVAARADALRRALSELGGPGIDTPAPVVADTCGGAARAVAERYNAVLGELEPEAQRALATAEATRTSVTSPTTSYEVRGRSIAVDNYRHTLSGTAVPKVAAPRDDHWGALLRWRWFENVPGQFPYTAGVFPYKREGEDPTRMFAGEGTSEQTNRRFHYLAAGQPAVRLSTAFDSVTLYGRDPGRRPDVYGKVGNSGVSVATIDDAKRLYSGFDLLAASTSVSMTINGPAPMILAMFLNAAIDQAAEQRLRRTGRWDDAVRRLEAAHPGRPGYRAAQLPAGHNGHGLGLLGASADEVLSPEEYAEVRATTLATVRGTVQADILKEEQAQNTCIFSVDFALKLQGDIQAFFVENDVRNFYSVSISGYHIAEAGANPITQLAFTLANGFAFVDYFAARGLPVDAFARNLSFFFSNGIDPEYAVIGRVARRIWAIAMRDVYGADARSQQLKYHIQTSGRSLHAQEIDFNDIRTTLQALYAIADNCNSLHTNAYDEAITTPTEESVRRALAIQLILNHEFGLLKNENPLQGSYFVDALTDAVEAAVLDEFARLADRGGVLGAMELAYQRTRIQEESLLYESKKHSGELPIIGVNTYLNPNPPDGVVEVALVRADDVAKRQAIDDVEAFRRRHSDRAAVALARLQQVAAQGGNVFAELMETVKCCTLGQITDALFAVGGQYRRSM